MGVEGLGEKRWRDEEVQIGSYKIVTGEKKNMKYSNYILTGSYSPIYVPIEDGETENEREKGQVGGSGGCSGGEHKAS